jgi:small subunit ribosomal protein S8
MVTDPIADLLTRIRNGLMARKKSIVAPYSKMNIAIVKILQKVGVLENVLVLSDPEKSYKKRIKIYLKYDENGNPVIDEIKRVSKPGRRVYAGYRELKPLKGGYGFRIISTSRGIMTDYEARKRKLGGEIICEVF